MKKFLFTLFLVSLFPLSTALALETSLRGFIALDMLNYEKIHRETGSAVIGIGVLDLKVFAEQDDMTASIKLDLDGKLEKENNIFEEAYATYRGFKNWRISLGKGVVRFQNLHWGAIENSYQDGGSVIGSENSFRKVSRKAFAAVSYGGRSQGFINQFTFWGESDEFDYNQDQKLQYVTTGSGANRQITGYKTEQVTAFNTSKQLGFANRLELFAKEDWKFSFGQLFYKNEFADKPTYAIDLGANYETAAMEMWFEALYGVTEKLPYESYTTKKKKEYFMQLGAEYYLDEKYSLVGNLEGVYAEDRAHRYVTFTENGTTYVPTSDQAAKSGSLVETFTGKVEGAVKYKLSKSAQFTVGGLYERKLAEKDGVKGLSFIRGVYNANSEAFKLASTISFWF